MNFYYKFFSLFFFLLFTLNGITKEGMWLLSLLKNNIEEMEAMGCNLTKDDIYHVNRSSLKDAIVGLGREGKPFSHFCTAEIISPKGLILTNHHCAHSILQSHSTTKQNILQNGFWASNYGEELVNPNITASILVKMEEVTSEVLKDITDNTDIDIRHKLITERCRKLIEEEEGKNKHHIARVKSMFNWNRYFLFTHIVYKDVRLVGAPPVYMGKFGGNTDNWMWPRHTADFALLRIYTSPDGNPANYAEENIPLKPKKYLPISIKGFNQDDFIMIMGFPGSTKRFLTSYGVKRIMNVINKTRFDIRTKKLDVLKKQMNKSEEVRIKYATKYARSANYWKYSEEQNKALTKLKTVEIKEHQEKLFTQWIDQDENLQQKYGKVLSKIDSIYSNREESDFLYYYLKEALRNGPDLFTFAIKAKKLENNLLFSNSTKQIQKSTAIIQETAKKFFRDFDKETEINLIEVLFKYFANNIEESSHPAFFEKIKNNNYTKFAKQLVENSIFADKQKLNNYLANPALKVLENDKVYQISKEIAQSMKDVQIYSKELNELKRLYTEGLIQMNKDKLIAPDANSTLRLNYALVKGYNPKDAVHYHYYTTLKGVFEKQDNNTREFYVDDKLTKLYNDKIYGRYANQNGELPTCFITDSDITGGNSGSPVINGNGELIGIAFDGNSEAMSGDIDFEENLQRCINVDIRYVLWIIEYYAKATHLIEELNIIE